MQGLTQRQQMVLDFIQQSIHDRGYPPTLREIGARMGIRSTSGVNDHLRALERKGYLTREDMKSRALRPVSPAEAPSHSRSFDESNGSADHSTLSHSLGSVPPANDDDMIDVQILGRVAAGLPLFAEEQVVDTVR